ncbi:mitochondrial ribosomal protein L38 [Osmia lignaria lignaria]|uniref:mitochondrial ribosomal protein L38 n=1 Tax=Osmia lignaria lignaria TaxID=1437193 RepID=UPI001478B813|nr:39S ribosomal protein L38, mitochondrial [Osmia lignaria]
MANTVFRIFTRDVSPRLTIRMEQVRCGHHLRGKPPTIARNLKQRLEELNQTDPALSFKVNIGFSVPKISSEKKSIWMNEIKVNRSDDQFEKQLRSGELPVNLETVKEVWWEASSPFHIRTIADHYGIFQDTFGDAYFFPVVPLEIAYKVEEDAFAKVYTGNVIKPAEASKPPAIAYKAESDSLWTLIMSTPDGNMQNSSNEYCHWFLGNIPENKIGQGEEIIDYLRPITPRGVGYYRYAFILYKQNQRLDYAEYKKTPPPCLRLTDRDWNTLKFYQKYQDYLTPAGLAFFQSDWDPTVTKFYHSVLGTKEPIFQYDFPKQYIKPQVWFPKRQPFNLYMDRYKDPKDVMKEFLLRKLKIVHPFKEPKPPLKYPNACTFPRDTPSWLKLEKTKERLGRGRVNEMNESV